MYAKSSYQQDNISRKPFRNLKSTLNINIVLHFFGFDFPQYFPRLEILLLGILHDEEFKEGGQEAAEAEEHAEVASDVGY